MCRAVREDVDDRPVPGNPSVEEKFVTGMSDKQMDHGADGGL
jgi:hypothetical protein